MRLPAFIVLFFMALGFSCRKDVAPLPAQPAPSPDFSFSATIDSVHYSFAQTDTSFNCGWDVSKTINSSPQQSSAIYQSYLSKKNSLDPTLTINKGRLYFAGTQASDSLFRSFFAAGNHPYSISAITGFEVNWYSQGFIWSTSEYTGYQGNSTFTITDVSFFTDANGVLSARVKANFSCNLYLHYGQSKRLNNGIFRGIFKNL